MIDDFEGKIIAEKYRIDSILRDSDLGVIYRAWHVMMDKPVTVKILAPALAVDKRFVERFLAEAKALSQAAHANILNVTDFGTDQRGITYAVYEAAPGKTVKTFTENESSVSVLSALDIARHAAAGIASAHSKGLHHGALTPEKILITNDDAGQTFKVFDFGVQPVGWNSDADIEYLAPEQYADTSKGDARSDIYSLGVILYEMLAGVAPFVGKTTDELKRKVDSEPPPPLSAFRSDLPPDLEPMILSAIAADPEKRYQSMRSFAEDLQILTGGVPVPQKAAAAPKRNIWQTAFIVLAGTAFLAAAFIYATSGKKTDPTTQLQADVGSLPVQPIGPATGVQEESLAKMPAMTEAEIMAVQNSNTTLPAMDSLPGGDGYNPWANGGAPPVGAPPAQYIPPGGQYYTIDPNGGSQFMPPDGGVILVPVPANTNAAIKPSPTPKTQPANNSVQTTPATVTTPKPLATPPKNDRSGAPPTKEKTAPADKPAKSGKQDS